MSRKWEQSHNDQGSASSEDGSYKAVW